MYEIFLNSTNTLLDVAIDFDKRRSIAAPLEENEALDSKIFDKYWGIPIL
ncbi:MAG: hypothetical protein ACOC35_14075 [Promethearchaeia archaeon]